MKKHNFFVNFLKKINIFINSLLEKKLNKLNSLFNWNKLFTLLSFQRIFGFVIVLIFITYPIYDGIRLFLWVAPYIVVIPAITFFCLIG